MSSGILATDKVFYLIALGLVVVAGALVPVGMVLDDHQFADEPMYTDVSTMEWLQFQSIDTTGEGVPGTVGPDETVEVAGREFTPSEGVTIEVEERDDRWCVRGSKGETTSEWHCIDPAKPPRPPGGTDPDDLQF